MTSSTSSSDSRINHTDPDDHSRYRARRIVGFKALLLGGSVFLVAMLLVNGLVSFARSQVPSPFSIHRIQTAAEALPAALQIPATDERKVFYVMGSSLVEFGFSPQVFDQALQANNIEAVSYNFGFGNSNPRIQKRFAERFAKTFEHHKGKVDYVLYEFAPFQATVARADQSEKLSQAAEAVLGDWSDFVKLAWDDHELAFARMNTKYIRNGVPAEAITSLLAKPIHGLNADKKPPIDEPAEPKTGVLQMDFYRKLHKEWFSHQAPGQWRIDDRGGLPISASVETMELAEQVMARLQHPERMKRALDNRIKCCDMEDLHLDEEMVSDFIQAIHYAQSVSGQVDVLLMPRNVDVVTLSVSGRERLNQALKRIEAETGARILDFSETPPYSVSNFFDTDHLTLFKGRVRFSEQLAQFYRDEMEE